MKFERSYSIQQCAQFGECLQVCFWRRYKPPPNHVTCAFAPLRATKSARAQDIANLNILIGSMLILSMNTTLEFR